MTRNQDTYPRSALSHVIFPTLTLWYDVANSFRFETLPMIKAKINVYIKFDS